MSCSYGPGRYDPSYEQHGRDYPIGFVRWTEQRNFQAVLHALDTGALLTESLISHRFSIGQAAAAYELLNSPEVSLGILLQYSGTADTKQRLIALPAEPAANTFLCVRPASVRGDRSGQLFQPHSHPSVHQGWCSFSHPYRLQRKWPGAFWS